MEIAALGFIGSKNIGDYIQTKAVIDIIDSKKIKILDRENLDKYNDDDIKTIINGWFMENPNNWPPGNNIIPLFISFHINPSTQGELLKKESLEYFKKHEPIGCRDHYTRDILLEKGINAYYSSCVTTSFERNKYLKKNTKPEGIIVIGAFDRLKPSINNKTFSQLIISTLKYPLKKIVYKIKISKFNKHLNKQKTMIQNHSQIVNTPIMSHNEGLILAEEMLKKIASCETLITSRIHAALPALAMGLKVIFIDEGLEHDNHKQRLSGLKNYFTCTNFKDFFMINLDSLLETEVDQKQIKKIKLTINKFLNQ